MGFGTHRVRARVTDTGPIQAKHCSELTPALQANGFSRFLALIDFAIIHTFVI